MMKAQTLKNKAYTVIKEKIMTCEYMPGDFINEKEIIQQINVSRTPIREAIILLEQEGLVSILPQRGVMVNRITLQDVIEAFQVREVIEPYALKHFGSRLDKETFKKYREMLSDPELLSDHEKGNLLDDEMHMSIVKAMNNHYFTDVINAIRVQTHRLRILSNRLGLRFIKTIDEHIEIIDAILAEKYDLAAELMSKHLAKAKEASINHVVGLE
ncbi:MAG TPA: GntR family transcriptional regulator [Clostridiaceae bacterium]|nr:GntR family transcriptional regulator [Clostridiaceae bacterium]